MEKNNDTNEYDIEKLKETFDVTIEVNGYVLLRDGTVVKKDIDGKYRKIDKESDAFAKLMYDSVYNRVDVRVYRAEKLSESSKGTTDTSKDTDDFNR